MKKILLHIIPFLLIGGLIFSSCDEDDKILYEDLKVGFQNSTASANLDIRSGEDVTFDVPVMLIGPKQDNDVTITLEADLTQTTALPGTHFVINNTEVTIPAGESFANVSITILFDGFVQPEEVYTIGLFMLESSADISPLYNRCNVTIKSIKPYDAADFVGKYVINEIDSDGAAIAPYNATTELYAAGETVDTFLISGLWDADSETIQFLLNKEDNTITIPEQNLYNTVYEGLYTIANIVPWNGSEVTGTFENGGGPITLPEGYLCLIQNGPYTDFNWVPAINQSIWTKADGKEYKPNYVEKRIAY